MDIRTLCFFMWIAFSSSLLPISTCLSAEGSHRRILADEVIGTAGSSPSPTPIESGNNTGEVAQISPNSKPSPSSSPVAPFSSPVFPLTPVSAPSSLSLPSSPSSSPPSPPVPGGDSSSSSSLSALDIIAITLASASFVVIFCVAAFCLRHKGASIRPWKSGASGELQKTFKTDVPAFSRSELEAACEDFSNIIGKSSDSIIFKGTLATGTEIAVTSIRVSARSWSTCSEHIFWKKVDALSRLKHKNIINIVGYFTEEKPFVRMLIFEYASNGTVYEHIHNKETEHLDWETRMRIIMGVVYALEYMHHTADPRVSHGNFDSNSVYLTEDYAAKVADYSVWKPDSLKSNTNSGECSSWKGSRSSGYDEVEMSDRFSLGFDDDIFSFGIFLLEIVSGKLLYCKQQGYLADWAVDYLNTPDMIAQFIDPNLKAYDYKQLEAILSVARHCVQMHFSHGLSMRQIASVLNEALGVSAEAAIPKSSPLIWAEMEILSQD